MGAEGEGQAANRGAKARHRAVHPSSEVANITRTRGSTEVAVLHHSSCGPDSCQVPMLHWHGKSTGVGSFSIRAGRPPITRPRNPCRCAVPPAAARAPLRPVC